MKTLNLYRKGTCIYLKRDEDVEELYVGIKDWNGTNEWDGLRNLKNFRNLQTLHIVHQDEGDIGIKYLDLRDFTKLKKLSISDRSSTLPILSLNA